MIEVQLDVFGGEAPVQATRRPVVSPPHRPAAPVQLSLLADERGQWSGQRTLVDAAGAAGEGTLLTVPPPEPVKCRECKHRLTHPASIAAGIGPTCADHLAGPASVAESLLDTLPVG